MLFDRKPFIAPFRASTPTIVVIVLLAAVLCITLAYDRFYPAYLSNNWQSISGGEQQSLTAEVQSLFRKYQQESADATRRVASLPEVRAQLLKRDSLSQAALFALLLEPSGQDVSIQIFDGEKRLLAWAGPRGLDLTPDQIAGRDSSFVQDGPLYSYLIVSFPLAGRNSIDGFVIGKRLIDVTYPINNRFINNEAFTSTFSSRFQIVPKFDFSGSPQKADSGLLAISLQGISGSTIGVAYLPRPGLASRLEESHDLAHHILELELLAAVLLLGGAVYRWRGTGARGSLVAKLAIPWIVRYVLIWINFPSGLFKWSIFDPIYFASPFGGGLAKSIGDLCLTSVCLLWSVYLFDSWLVRSRSRMEKATNPANLGMRLLRIIAVPLLGLVVCLFLRGFAALVQSAMFDSNLEYNDPAFLLPSIELSCMLVGLLLAGAAFVLAGAGVISLSARFVEGSAGWRRPKLAGWLAAGISLLTVGVLFGMYLQNSLMGQFERMVYLLGLTGFAVLSSRRVDGKTLTQNVQFLALTAAAAGLVLLPRLDRGAHELDRNHVELLASEISRPVDNWLTLVANQALDELSDREAAGVLASADSDDIEKLGFTKWAKSILSREGYNCTVTYFDQKGSVLSEFHIGTPPHPIRARRAGAAWSGRSIHVEEKSADGAVVRWYMAFTPVKSDSGELLGGVRVELSGAKQAILRGEAPEFLRSQSRTNLERQFRTLVLSEYIQGKLVSASGETIPLDRTLPEVVRSGGSEGTGIWLDEEIEGTKYETYFLREQQAGSADAWIALSLERLGLRWHLYSFLRYVLFVGLLVAGSLLLLLTARLAAGWRFTFTFRSKLLAAFAVVSLIPVIILAYYNREYTSERMRENAIKWVNNQSSIFLAELQRQLGMSIPVVLSQLTDERCSDIAGDLNADFVVYRGAALQASSKPEMFAAELLDRHLSAKAYLNSVLKKRSFYAEDQIIGKLPYVVGYRPIVAENGSIIGVVAVPTLYRQAEVNAELSRRDVYLYGAYAVALAFALVAGTAFAGQISAPIRRLKRATQQVARGTLDVDLEGEGRDEMGDLEQAFGEMVRDLKLAQAQMIKAQRELAWREMAKQIAHEIKNPLTPMKLSIQHLRQAYRDGAKDFSRLLESISDTLLVQIETLSRIATEFSTFARMPERKLEVCDIHEILGEARDLYEQDGKIKFVTDFGPGHPRVNADREELRRVFINILRNAVQAMEHGGTVAMSTRRSGESILIRIKDDGPGIPAEVRARLFEPNFSTKTDGMGLGLAIVKKIIDDLGGSITLESSVGNGTAAIILLPLVGGTESVETANDRQP
ncbi:MAG TPA: ATP-binding protein [Bacteroidota bacterium]|jgi:signal transduction histidine kinase